MSIITSVLFYAIRPCNDLDTIVANGRKQTVLHLFLNAALKTVAYLRVSTRSQDLANQKLAILEFSQKRRFPIDQFIESRMSSRQSPLERRIEQLLAALEPGDCLLVSELSRLGRSLSQVIQIVDTLVHRKIRFIAIKEGVEFDGKQDLRTKVMIALFGLFAEVERNLISERTKEGLAAAKARGTEHLKWVMYGGEHTPQEVIDKVTEGNLGEADYDLLEHNIRADLGSGKPDRVKADIEKFKRTLGLGIYKLEPGAGNFIVGSYGTAKISWIGREIKQEKYFTPVAPDMALSCTDQPGCPRVTRQGKEGIETLHKMNTATWNASQLVAATSLELLKAVGKRAV